MKQAVEWIIIAIVCVATFYGGHALAVRRLPPGLVYRPSNLLFGLVNLVLVLGIGLYLWNEHYQYFEFTALHAAIIIISGLSGFTYVLGRYGDGRPLAMARRIQPNDEIASIELEAIERTTARDWLGARELFAKALNHDMPPLRRAEHWWRRHPGPRGQLLPHARFFIVRRQKR
jgi:hypothetical protein